MTITNEYKFKKPTAFVLWCGYHKIVMNPFFMVGAIERLNSGKPVMMRLNDEKPREAMASAIPHGV